MMSADQFSRQAAVLDFEEAHRQAALRDVLARLTRTTDELLSYDEVAHQLQLSERTERGVQTIPVAAIVGSVGRAADYTRDFLPRRAADSQRWANVRNAFMDPRGEPLPPIEVYQVGQVYFVLDGNHRVSVARNQGVTYMDAHVIEIHSPVELTPDMTPDDLICQAELAEFLNATGLGSLSAHGFHFNVEQCGQYPKLHQHIRAHQFLARRDEGRILSDAQAAADWFANVYAPLVRALRDRGMREWFPGYTETDLYLWISEHHQQLRDELGWDVPTEAAATDLAVRTNARARRDETATGSWRTLRLSDRYLAHAFQDILVPLRDTPPSWHALEQALVVAQRENARVHGLHVTRAKNPPHTDELQTRFLERCAALGVAGDFAIETGAVTAKICERALLTDLIVLTVAHPPAGGMSALTSGWRAILKQAARPVLAVPQLHSPMQRALLIFDNTPRAREALFIAAYLCETWHTALTVLTPPSDPAAADYARAYLDLHELTPAYLAADLTPPAILDLLTADAHDLLLLGSDTPSPLNQVRGRGILTALLRESPHPLLIAQ